MNDLVTVLNDQLVTDSLQVAEHFGKQHKDVLKAIDNLVAQNCAAKSFFFEATHENRGKQYKMYYMNRDGFSLLVMGFTGKEALEWKIKFIEAFNEMEKTLRSTPEVKPIDKSKQMRAEAMLLNAKSRQAGNLGATAWENLEQDGYPKDFRPDRRLG